MNEIITASAWASNWWGNVVSSFLTYMEKRLSPEYWIYERARCSREQSHPSQRPVRECKGSEREKGQTEKVLTRGNFCEVTGRDPELCTNILLDVRTPQHFPLYVTDHPPSLTHTVCLNFTHGPYYTVTVGPQVLEQWYLGSALGVDCHL